MITITFAPVDSADKQMNRLFVNANNSFDLSSGGVSRALRNFLVWAILLGRFVIFLFVCVCVCATFQFIMFHVERRMSSHLWIICSINDRRLSNRSKCWRIPELMAFSLKNFFDGRQDSNERNWSQKQSNLLESGVGLWNEGSGLVYIKL